MTTIEMALAEVWDVGRADDQEYGQDEGVEVSAGLLCKGTQIAAFGKLHFHNYDSGAEIVLEATAIDDARARLASAAPEMARALLRLEAVGHDFRCAYCAATSNPEEAVPHREGCILDAALRKAGIR